GNTAGGGAGTSADCLKLAQQWSSAIGSATQGQDQGAVFSALESAVPDALKPAAKTLADAYGKYITIFKKYSGGDIAKAMSDPAVQQALRDIGKPEVAAAQKQISDYFDKQCKS
ncbi:MAG: hypothetical protein WCI22_15870, partial [Actinomycetota bacterium]